MSPDQMNVAIAESLGWKTEYVFGNGMDCDACVDPNGLVQSRYPNYAGSLDAMHEAILSDAARFGLIRCQSFGRRLSAIVARDFKIRQKNERNDVKVAECFNWCATAAQRAEAYLKTKGLFK